MMKLSIRLKQAVILIMVFMMTMASCFAFTGCSKTDQSDETLQIEEDVVEVEAEPDDFVTP